MKPVGLIVTTSKRPTDALEAVARAVAERCKSTFVPRKITRAKSVDWLCAQHNATAAYVVSRHRHELRVPGGGRAFVNPGPLHMFLRTGRNHPLIHALSPEGEPPVEHLVGVEHVILHRVLPIAIRC